MLGTLSHVGPKKNMSVLYEPTFFQGGQYRLFTIPAPNLSLEELAPPPPPAPSSNGSLTLDLSRIGFSHVQKSHVRSGPLSWFLVQELTGDGRT